MSVIDVIVALTGVITVLVSLYTVASTTRRGAFEDLQKVVAEMKGIIDGLKVDRDNLQRELKTEKDAREKLERDFEFERKQRLRFEDWARRLSRQLEDAKIVPVPLE